MFSLDYVRSSLVQLNLASESDYVTLVIPYVISTVCVTMIM